eukprot:m.26860 g.26860  ORF g.26860 m.26860 type:complete len:707 (-) comp15573_c0_seq1:25-2145(-)
MSMNVKVAVRMRPLNSREKKLGETGSVLNFESKDRLSIRDPACKVEDHVFNYDYAFDSSDADAPNYTAQDEVFNELGVDIIDNTMNGFNGCILAYGQTGAGKSYSMMGNPNDTVHKGLIPRICEGLFSRIKTETENGKTITVSCSYIEIYSEKVYDLLDENGGRHRPLAIRDSSKIGPFVDGLTHRTVSDVDMVSHLFDQGNALRHVKATAMNATSSRSHAMFQMVVEISSEEGGRKLIKRSRINLVDLAGSERQKKTEATGAALKEGASINVSLTTLGLVISGLVKQSNKPSKSAHIPYRDSTLTWLLRENFGGNSKTCMIAAISPAADNYDETLSTLRYADRAKHIVNKAIINETPADKYVRELQEHVVELQTQLAAALENGASHTEVVALTEEKEVHEDLLREESKDYNVKLATTKKSMEDTKFELDRNRDALEMAMHHERDLEEEFEAKQKEMQDTQATLNAVIESLKTQLAESEQKYLTYAASVEPRMSKLKEEVTKNHDAAVRYQSLYEAELNTEEEVKDRLLQSSDELHTTSEQLSIEKSIEQKLQDELKDIGVKYEKRDESFSQREHEMDQQNLALQKAFKELSEKATEAREEKAKATAQVASLEAHIFKLKAQLMQAADGTLWNKTEQVVHDGPTNLVRPSSIRMAQHSQSIKQSFTDLASNHEKDLMQHVKSLEDQLMMAKVLEQKAMTQASNLET